MEENTKVLMTREKIRKALLVQLRSRPLQKVTVKQLCETAGVNRSTFYHHYGSPHDVLRDMSRCFLEDIERTLRTADPSDMEATASRVEMVLQYAEENLELSRILVNNKYDPDYPVKLLSLPRISELLENRTSGMDPGEKNAAISFVIYGAFKLLEDWINEEDRLSPGEETYRILHFAERVFGEDEKKLKEERE